MERSERIRMVRPTWCTEYLSLNIPGLILEIVPKLSIPVMCQDAFFVERAGLVSYAANTYEVGRLAARLADRIFKSARPGDVPVEQPTKFELVINVKSATDPVTWRLH